MWTTPMWFSLIGMDSATLVGYWLRCWIIWHNADARILRIAIIYQIKLSWETYLGSFREILGLDLHLQIELFVVVWSIVIAPCIIVLLSTHMFQVFEKTLTLLVYSSSISLVVRHFTSERMCMTSNFSLLTNVLHNNAKNRIPAQTCNNWTQEQQ